MRIKKTSQTTVLQNEIAVDYSTDETKTGYNWIDNKPIYRKVINFGALPNATTKSVAHNINNVDKFITIKGFTFIPDGTGNRFPLPFVVETNLAQCIRMYADITNVTIGAGTDRSAWEGFAILEYTKTTD